MTAKWYSCLMKSRGGHDPLFPSLQCISLDGVKHAVILSMVIEVMPSVQLIYYGTFQEKKRTQAFIATLAHNAVSLTGLHLAGPISSAIISNIGKIPLLTSLHLRMNSDVDLGSLKQLSSLPSLSQLELVLEDDPMDASLSLRFPTLVDIDRTNSMMPVLPKLRQLSVQANGAAQYFQPEDSRTESFCRLSQHSLDSGPFCVGHVYPDEHHYLKLGGQAR